MTHQELVKKLKSEAAEIGSLDKEEKELLSMIVDALETRIPKKPLHMHKNYYCPICKEDGWMLWDDAVPNDTDAYCGKCGQAIDWEGVNEN